MANTKPPKVGIGALAEQIQSGVTSLGDLASAESDYLNGPWRALFTVVGVSGPAYLQLTNTAIRGLKRYGG